MSCDVHGVDVVSICSAGSAHMSCGVHGVDVVSICSAGSAHMSCAVVLVVVGVHCGEVALVIVGMGSAHRSCV